MSFSTISTTPLPVASQLNAGGDNYATWSVVIEETISGKGLSGYLDGSITMPPLTTATIPPDATPIYSLTPSRDEWTYRDRATRSIIITNIINPVGLGVDRTGSAHICWMSVAAICEPQSDAALSLAEQEINMMMLLDGSSVDALTAHITALNEKRQRLSNLGKVLTDKDFKNIFVRSLPTSPDFQGLLGSLYSTRTTIEAISLVQTHVINMTAARTKFNAGNSAALAATSGFAPQRPKRNCTNTQCKSSRTSHNTADCYWPGGGKEGQFPPGFGQRRGGGTPSPRAAVAFAPHLALSAQADFVISEVDHSMTVDYVMGTTRVSIEDKVEVGDDEICLPHDYPYILERLSFEDTSSISQCAVATTTFEGFSPTTTHTFLDSGASDHFFIDKSDFVRYTTLKGRTGQSAAGKEGSFLIAGYGSVTKLVTVNGVARTLTFHHALHTPTLAANLISVSRLDTAGYLTEFSGGESRVKSRDGQIILGGKGSGGMYLVNLQSEARALLSTSHPTTLGQWHRRFTHASPEAIQRLVSGDLVDGLSITDSAIHGQCEDCILARQTRRPFDNPTSTDVKPGTLVSFDLWGPSRIRSIGGASYFMPIVDSGTSYKYGAYLADKSDASTIPAFDKYRIMAETQLGTKIKRVRTDNAFNSKAWEDYFTSHGIIHETSSPYSSAQNGLAERAIRTTIEDARALLRDAGLEHQYWALAAEFSIYSRNLLPSRRHPGVIPAEAWTGSRQDVSHLRVFGSKCWVKIPTVNGVQVTGGSKLDDRGAECIFLGYGSGSGNYVIQDLQGRVYEGRDVIFEEGVPHRTVNVGEEDNFELPVGYIPFNSAGSNISSSGNDEQSPPSLTNETPPLEVTANSETVLVQPRRSERVSKPSEIATRSTDYLAREKDALDGRADWATGSSRPSANFAHSAFEKFSAELDDFIALSATTEPRSLQVPTSWTEAMHMDERRWKAAADVEMGLHRSKGTWDLVDRPVGVNVMDCKWVFDVKLDGDGSWVKDKARLVGKGFTQQLGIDYSETWAAVTRLESVRMTAAIAASLDLELWQIDFISAYLNSETKEDIYMRQPPGYVVVGQEDKVCKLKKTIYGTMQGAHDWVETLKTTYNSLDYYTSRADPCVRVKTTNNETTITNTYTDDVIGASTSKREASERKNELAKIWDIKDMGESKRFLGMRVVQDLVAGTVTLSQKAYFEQVIERYAFEHIAPRNTPLPIGIILDASMSPHTDDETAAMVDKPFRSVLGCVMWGQLATRPDLSFAVSLLSRYQSNPGVQHWQALMHVIGYIKSTIDYGLVYSRDDPLVPLGYVDADHAGCRDTRRSTSGYVFTMSGAPVSWSAKRQEVPAMSTVEAEYISLARGAQQLKWMHAWLDEVGIRHTLPGVLRNDNRGAISLTHNTRSHQKVKHIDIRTHYIRELVEAGEIDVEFVRGTANPADLFTKPIARGRYLEDLHIRRV